MRPARLFVSQSKLDAWLSDSLVDVDGEVMTLKDEGRSFQLKTAVVFTEELTGAGDPHDLVGKVKDLEQIVELGGEYASGSVILGDHAYTVIEGFVGDPIHERSSISAGDRSSHGESLAAAMRQVTGDPGREGELDLLARFFLQSRPQ